MRIDAHQEFDEHHTPDRIWPVLSRNRFDGCIAVQARQGMEEAHRLLDLADSHAFIFGVVTLEAVEHPKRVSRAEGFVDVPGLRGSAEELRPHIQEALRMFGPDRLIFGTRWPQRWRGSTWKEVLAAFTQALGPQPMEIRSLILGENAIRCYGLSIRP